MMAYIQLMVILFSFLVYGHMVRYALLISSLLFCLVLFLQLRMTTVAIFKWGSFICLVFLLFFLSHLDCIYLSLYAVKYERGFLL